MEPEITPGFEFLSEDGGRILRMNIRGVWNVAVTRSAQESLGEKVSAQAALPIDRRVKGLLVDARGTMVQPQNVASEIGDAQKALGDIPTAIVLPQSALAGFQIKRLGGQQELYHVFEDEVAAREWLRSLFTR